MSSIDIPFKYYPKTSHSHLTLDEQKLKDEYGFLRKYDPDELRRKILRGYFPNVRLYTDKEIEESRLYHLKFNSRRNKIKGG